MDEKRLLEQISQLIDSTLSASEERMNQRFEEIENRLDVIQEDTAITRSAVNALIEWTEQVTVITQVRFPIQKTN